MRSSFFMCVWIVAPCLVHALDTSGQDKPEGASHLTSEQDSSRDLSDAPAAIIDFAEHDAGRVFKGELARYEFTITNQGSAPLEIIRVRPGCGCTLATYDERIAPGATGRISAELRTQSLSGNVQKTITVTTNDPERPTLQLSLLATVVDVIRVEPIPGHTVYPSPGLPLSRSFLVHVEPADSLQITSVSCSVPFVRAQLQRSEAANDRIQTYEVQLEVARDAPFGRTEFAVVLGTDLPSNPSRIVDLACEKGIVASAQVSFAPAGAAANGPLTQTLLLKSRDVKVNILAVESPGPYLTTTFMPLNEGAMQLVRVTWDASVEPAPGPQSLRIKTDSPDQPLIQIPVVFNYEEAQALARARRSSANRRLLRQSSASVGRSAAASLLDVTQIRGRTLRVEQGKHSEFTYPVRIKPAEPLRIISASCDVPFMTAEAERDSADPRVYHLTLLIAPDAPFGRTAAFITFETDSPTAPRQIVPLFCEKGIVANTTSINLGTVRTGTKLPLTQPCLLKNSGGQINIVSIRSTDSQVQVSAKPLMNGSHQLLTVSCDGSGSPGSHSGKILIDTDNPHQSRMELEFRYQIANTDLTAQP
jgi:hypothetical protein